MTGRLDGKVAIITGASTGLGPVMGALFVREGARVLLAARREELVREAADAAGEGAIAMRADVTNEDDVAAMVARAVDEFGHVDIMCNNAAAPGTDKWVWEQTLENWNATIAHRRHRRDAVHERGAEAVDARAPCRGDPQLLVDGGLQRHGPQDALRHRQGVAARLHPRRSPSKSASTASAATASCREASTRSCGRTGSDARPRSRASTTRATARASSRGVALRDISSPSDVANLALVPGQRRSPDHHRAVDPGRRRRLHAGMTERGRATVRRDADRDDDSRRHAEWEQGGTIEELARIAETADRLGYHHLTCSEHIGLPAVGGRAPRGAVLGPAGNLRLPRGPHRADPLRDRRPRPRRTTIPSRSPSATARSTRSATAG